MIRGAVIGGQGSAGMGHLICLMSPSRSGARKHPPLLLQTAAWVSGVRTAGVGEVRGGRV